MIVECILLYKFSHIRIDEFGHVYSIWIHLINYVLNESKFNNRLKEVSVLRDEGVRIYDHRLGEVKVREVSDKHIMKLSEFGTKEVR